MAPHGAPSPGRRRPPISPASLPAGPARLRRGALRRGRRRRGPSRRLLRSVPPSVRWSTGEWRSAVQSLAGGPGNRRTAPGSILGEGSERLRGTSVCLLVSFWLGSRLPPPPTPAELSRRRPRRFLHRSLRKASGRSTAARRPGVRPYRRAGKAGPAWPTRSPREAGRGGRGDEWRGRSVAGWRAASSTASPPPSPPNPPRPYPAVPPPPSPPRGHS